ncbi:MAG: helix-turn-helix domain-containing protein, partial [Spirochaetaceae bacterium]|nr:helix-turn-helix domain-containing protein [Spirochaetaceae bacterium]
MESFGATLKQAREARGIDLERASLETNITTAYLDALEKELISSFPCDTYLIGFLKNYAE